MTIRSDSEAVVLAGGQSGVATVAAGSSVSLAGLPAAVLVVSSYDMGSWVSPINGFDCGTYLLPTNGIDFGGF